MGDQDFYFFMTDKGATVSVVRAPDLRAAEKKAKDRYDWVMTFTLKEVAALLHPKELDPLNCAAALRYAVLEHGGMLTVGEREALASAATSIEKTLWS